MPLPEEPTTEQLLETIDIGRRVSFDNIVEKHRYINAIVEVGLRLHERDILREARQKLRDVLGEDIR